MNQDVTPKPVNDNAKFYMKIGFPFQLMLCLGVAVRAAESFFTPLLDKAPFAVDILDSVGMLIFGYYLLRIYSKKKSTGLITTGLFKYTRHPMYTGGLMFAVRLWWPTTHGVTTIYCVTLAMFLIGIFVAGYMQEKETLAKFGTEAEEYYRKTPRLFLWYPFCPR